MRFVGIILIILSLPLFLTLLGSGEKWRRVLFVALGALPILQGGLNVDASIVNWADWNGHTKGLLITILDSLALAICLRLGKAGRPVPPLLWLFVLYLVGMTPALFTGYFTPAFFYLFQFLRVTLYFWAVFLVCRRGGSDQIIVGLAIAVIANAMVAGYQSATGIVRAPGLTAHANLAGMLVNLAAPLFVACAMERRQTALCLIALACGAFVTVTGGSRAGLAFYALGLTATVLASLVVRPNARKWGIALVAALGLAVAFPFAMEKLSERFSAGYALSVDAERQAFERAAWLMIDKHPFGVGLNQYVMIANTEGYLDKADVTWGTGSRSTSVHNIYLLVRAESGLLGLLPFLAWLLVPMAIALRRGLQRSTPDRAIVLASGVALAVTALHGMFEWMHATATIQYTLAVHLGLVAAAMRPASVPRRPPPSRPAVSHLKRAFDHAPK